MFSDTTLNRIYDRGSSVYSNMLRRRGFHNSVISASNAKIEDAQLVDVTDYKAYIQPEVKNVSVITNEIEKL